ncbi:hypothetical protein LCGC14_0695320 [marine sediment metagenome]|uniref:Uncharacterized protein n=1 Tax=marine sediment metagenome TaxID=412755 RepID=A0A0F9T5I3_9ZZZZ
MAEIKNPFARSEERVLDRLRASRDRTARTRPLPKLGTEGGKVSRRRSSPVLALYERLGVDVKDLQV